ncbi:MAG: hypothetical protein RI897_3829 [Verrucomicrobiota bacterium]|jgi:hypothetical protein
MTCGHAASVFALRASPGQGVRPYLSDGFARGANPVAARSRSWVVVKFGSTGRDESRQRSSLSCLLATRACGAFDPDSDSDSDFEG